MTSFSDAVRLGLQNIIKFKGTSSRSEYWWFILFYMLCFVAVGILSAIHPILGLTGFLLLPIILAMLSLTFRRVRDVMGNAWLVGIVFILNFVSYFMIFSAVGDMNSLGPNPTPEQIQNMLAGGDNGSMMFAGLLQIVNMILGLVLFVITLLPGRSAKTELSKEDGPISE